MISLHGYDIDGRKKYYKNKYKNKY